MDAILTNSGAVFMLLLFAQVDLSSAFDDGLIKVIGGAIFLGFAFIASIVACCAFCPGCPLHAKRTRGRLEAQQNVTMSQIPTVMDRNRGYPVQQQANNLNYPPSAYSYPPQQTSVPLQYSVQAPPPYPGLQDQYRGQNEPMMSPQYPTKS